MNGMSFIEFCAELLVKAFNAFLILWAVAAILTLLIVGTHAALR